MDACLYVRMHASRMLEATFVHLICGQLKAPGWCDSAHIPAVAVRENAIDISKLIASIAALQTSVIVGKYVDDKRTLPKYFEQLVDCWYPLIHLCPPPPCSSNVRPSLSLYRSRSFSYLPFLSPALFLPVGNIRPCISSLSPPLSPSLSLPLPLLSQFSSIPSHPPPPSVSCLGHARPPLVT